jgi:hypothetical protein
MRHKIVARRSKESKTRQTFQLDSTIYFRHAFLIFDLNEKKQRTESSTKKIFNFFMGNSEKLEGNFLCCAMFCLDDI